MSPGQPDTKGESEYGVVEQITADSGDVELRLDALLAAQTAKHAAPEVSKPAVSRLDRLRSLFVTQLVPVVDELRAKYAESGLYVDMDVTDFLEGGRRMSITIEFRQTGLRLDGIVMPDAIAFQQTRYTEFDRGGLAASGPTIRARTLDATAFRHFLCERITNLVQAVVGHRR